MKRTQSLFLDCFQFSEQQVKVFPPLKLNGLTYHSVECQWGAVAFDIVERLSAHLLATDRPRAPRARFSGS